MGGFTISFLTDNVQGAMVTGLIIIAAITIGSQVEIKPNLIAESGYLEPSLIGWQIVYILPVAVLTNDFFLANYWLRAFASKTDRDLWIGITMAVGVIFAVLILVGFTGLVSYWSGAFPGDPPVSDGSVAFFLVLAQLPAWVVGIVLVMVVTLSTAAFDSLQSAMVSTASNDLFRNRLNVWIIRAGVVAAMIPAIVVALRAPSILQVYLISDLLSAATIPVLLLGLSDTYFWYWRGFEVLVGGLGGILTVFIYGLIYYGNASQAGSLLILQQGLYSGDWGAFGAFVAAPIGGLLWGAAALACRLGLQYILCRRRGVPFDGLDRPDPTVVHSQPEEVDYDTNGSDVPIAKTTGKFF